MLVVAEPLLVLPVVLTKSVPSFQILFIIGLDGFPNGISVAVQDALQLQS
jgi:hypothetical protein